MRISVICPVFKTSPDLLSAAVHSVLATGQEHVTELLLIDDASRNTGTRNMLERLSAEEPRIRLLHQTKNAGPSAAREAGLRAAASDWIGFTDADDLWLPGHTEAMLALMERHPEAQWIGSHYVNLMQDGCCTGSFLSSTTVPASARGRKPRACAHRS